MRQSTRPTLGLLHGGITRDNFRGTDRRRCGCRSSLTDGERRKERDAYCSLSRFGVYKYGESRVPDTWARRSGGPAPRPLCGRGKRKKGRQAPGDDATLGGPWTASGALVAVGLGPRSCLRCGAGGGGVDRRRRGRWAVVLVNPPLLLASSEHGRAAGRRRTGASGTRGAVGRVHGRRPP